MQDKQEGERKGERKGETSPPRHDLGARVTQKTSERPQILQEAWMQQRSHEWVFGFFFFFLYLSVLQASSRAPSILVLPTCCVGLLARGFGRGLRYSRTRRVQN